MGRALLHAVCFCRHPRLRPLLFHRSGRRNLRECYHQFAAVAVNGCACSTSNTRADLGLPDATVADAILDGLVLPPAPRPFSQRELLQRRRVTGGALEAPREANEGFGTRFGWERADPA